MHELTAALDKLRRRMGALALAAALGWAAFAAAAVLLGWCWVDVVMDAPPAVRIAGIAVAGAAAVAVLVARLRAAAAARRPDRLARRLDAVGQTDGQILSGYELLNRAGPAGREDGLTAGLAAIAVARAAALARGVSRALAAPAGVLVRPAVAVGAALLTFGLLALLFPALVRSEWRRLADPFGDNPVFSHVRIQVEPGDVRLVYGGSVEIRAWPAAGGPVDRLETVLVSDAGTEEVVPMFADAANHWRTALANVVADAHYYVRAHGARTARFRLQVVTVPQITGVTAVLKPPAYTHLPATRGPLPPNGIVALPGTEVELIAASNRPLAGGEVEFTGDDGVRRIALAPTAAGNEVSGAFRVAAGGKLVLRVKDQAGQASTDAFTTSVALLADQRPFVRFLEPRATSFATPDAKLPVELMAEDDFGLSAVVLYRSLNDSRATGLDLPVKAGGPPRQRAAATVSLGGFGLKPGDVVRLVARAEDNDPAGAKGSESGATTVQIISQQDFNRMMLARAGLEMLLSKYQQAQRRLETTEAALRGMKQDLQKVPADRPLTEEQKAAAAAAAAAAGDSAAEVDKARQAALPFDVDARMAPRLERISARLLDVAGKLRDGTPAAATAGDQIALLDGLIHAADGDAKEFEAQTIEPLEHLAKIYPLIADQRKFVQIYKRQANLVDRLAGVKDGPADDPRAKARMRDMQDEQKLLRDQLVGLLDDIDSHASALPEDPKLDPLRQSAVDFARRARLSGAADEMELARGALDDLLGDIAHAQASEAAEHMKQLIEEPSGGGGGLNGMADAALKFQPVLGPALGDTVAQLLNAGGLGDGGGYSMAGDANEAVGVYGNSMLANAARAGGEARDGGIAGGSVALAGDPNGGGRPAAARAGGGGAAAVPVPAQYQRKVDLYFRRVADDLQKE
jgi:hypothetical protein